MNTVHHDSAIGPNDIDGIRDLILGSARELLRTDGYEGFSMRNLAKAAGCAPGTIYLYFANKSELFRCLVDECFEHLQRSLCALRDRHCANDPVLLLRKALYTYIEFGLRHCEEYGFALAHESGNQDRNSGLERTVEVLRSIVARCVYEGAFRPEVDVDCTTQALWAAAHGITSLLIERSQFGRDQRGGVIEQVISNAVESLLAVRPARAARLSA